MLTTFCPWKSHLLELEEEAGIAEQLKYVVYPEGDPSGKWRIQVKYGGTRQSTRGGSVEFFYFLPRTRFRRHVVPVLMRGGLVLVWPCHAKHRDE